MTLYRGVCYKSETCKFCEAVGAFLDRTRSAGGQYQTHLIATLSSSSWGMVNMCVAWMEGPSQASSPQISVQRWLGFCQASSFRNPLFTFFELLGEERISGPLTCASSFSSLFSSCLNKFSLHLLLQAQPHPTTSWDHISSF